MSTTIGVNDRAVLAVDDRFDGRIEHGVNKLSVGMRPNGPANDQSIEAVDDRRQVHLASRDMELCDIGKPLLIRGRPLEVAV